MTTSTQPELILVLDDEPHISGSIKALLELRGYRVVTTDTCESALELIKQLSPKLILADMNMPSGSGLEFIEKLQCSGLLQHHPVIFVSAMARIEDIQRGMKAGARDYIPKPFTPE